MTARPCIKSAGGKTRLLSEILSRLPEKIETYYEPFVGGGAVFFALAAEKRFKRAVIGDSNGELVRAYACIAEIPELVIAALKVYAAEHNEKRYYMVRGLVPEALEPAVRAARFIYLNRTCFNGLHRVNKRGEFNVPFGDYANPNICDEENLLAVSEVLRGTALTSLDFEETVLPAKPGDAIYFDCPYAPISETSNFTGYTAGGFTARDQARLQSVAAQLVGRGIYVLLSNSDTPFVRELYAGFRIEEVQARRNVNSNGKKRGKVGELLISRKN